MNHRLANSRFYRAAFVTAVACITAGTSASLAHAQNWSIHATGSASTVATDNVNNASDEENPESAVFSTFAPALLFSFESPRTVHVSNLAIGYTTYYFSDALPNSFNSSLAHSSQITTSRFTTLGLGLTFGLGQVGSTLTDPQNGQPPTVAGGTTFRNLGANQNFRWDFARNWNMSQGLTVAQTNSESGGAGAGATNSVSRGRNANFSVGFGKSWLRTAAGLSANIGLVGIASDGTGMENFDCDNDAITCNLQSIGNVAFNIRRDISQGWSTNLALGVAGVTSVDSNQEGNTGTTLTPNGVVAVNYFRPVGTVTLDVGATAGHTIAANLLQGTVTRNANAFLRGGIPLPWFRRENVPIVNVGASVGRTYSWALSEGDREEPIWHVDSADVSVGWVVYDGWNLAARYQLVRQTVDDVGRNAVNPVPVDFIRHTFLFTVGGRFPARQAARLPSANPTRLDRANEESTGDEGQQIGTGGGAL